MVMGTAKQLWAASSLSSVTVGGIGLPVAKDIKLLEVIQDRHLTFDKHVTSVARPCNYYKQVICHILHLLTMDLAQMLACSLILFRINYCNAALHGIPAGTIHKFNCSGYRTTPQGSFFKRQDDPHC